MAAFNGLWSTRTFTNSYRVNSYFFIGQLVLFCNSYFGQLNSYFFFGQLVLFSLVNSYFFINYLRYAMFLYYGTPWTFNITLRLLKEHQSAHISVFFTHWRILRAADYHPIKIIEPLYDKTNEINYTPIEPRIRLGGSESSLCAQWVVNDRS